ncbi:Co/Zn/Cd efflux system membrane fusion protein [Aquipluma nitroreducens]|uniref:Co/Zn/Cd efflux system membrane fusion protein n=1 Tax=Aquipluma nitroreducens TaxID=2010828 RepID=A0A5K7S8T4_9BACT|nr:efflux RND transporter periplasmic adaptor subunit [Aquipluma nitroreducens]BBE17714.1 Co/Zn/Cd efflux system membrane fusion protein [Aquipluma nitroreducens]
MQKTMILSAIVIILFGCKQKQEAVKQEVTAIKVKAQAVQTFNGLSDLRYSGTVEAAQTIPLSFQSSGTVEQVLVQEGDAVRKGQLLATVNKADNQSMYNLSLATYQQAKDAYDRLKQVYDNGSLSEVKWVEMETNLKKAESQLQVSKNSLEKCNLYAPVSGIIGKRNVEPGQSSLSSFSPLELVKIETILVKISVPENEIGKIKKGMNASFTISALENKQYEGTITNVGVVADQFSRTYEVKITVKNTNLEIKPGMVCDVTLNTTAEKQMVLIPYNAISKDTDGSSFVYVVTDDQKSVRKQIVKLGDYQNNGLEILSGLTANQSIVVEGKEKLTDNSQIIL